jgi:hypothetical protein
MIFFPGKLYVRSLHYASNNGRNDAPSGLGLSLELLRGVRVLESYEPTANGAKVVDYTSDPVKGANKIATRPGKQAAVTFGAGVTTQELNNAIDPSSLFTMGAAHGTYPVKQKYRLQKLRSEYQLLCLCFARLGCEIVSRTSNSLKYHALTLAKRPCNLRYLVCSSTRRTHTFFEPSY